jgi:hypothetical protein
VCGLVPACKSINQSINRSVCGDVVWSLLLSYVGAVVLVAHDHGDWRPQRHPVRRQPLVLVGGEGGGKGKGGLVHVRRRAGDREGEKEGQGERVKQAMHARTKQATKQASKHGQN